MKQKAFPLINKGMNRDLSVSKTGESSAYENHNIRILARDKDTLMSVTNERGNVEIPLGQYDGELVGWNVLNEHVILFCHNENKDKDKDTIYRIDYNGVGFNAPVVLISCDLGFDTKNPIESVVYYETENIQKIYWVDGVHVLRFMNFMATKEERDTWDATTFDSNRLVSFLADVKITKDNAGSVRPNGVVQYLLTYFNKHGQETGYAWISDLIYLSPLGRGGAADETNNNEVFLSISGLDTSYTHFRIYSVFRSAYNGETVSYLVTEREIKGSTATVIDDGAHLTLVDSTSLLYLGSQPVVAGTLTHKDQTLFLGDLRSIGRSDYSALEDAIHKNMFVLSGDDFVYGQTWEAKDECIQFIYSDNAVDGIHDLPYTPEAGTYTYDSQLVCTSSEIMTFKGGEKYRFALKFKLQDGSETDAFWIGDKENPLYPIVMKDGTGIKRVVVKCTIPADVISVARSYGNIVFSAVQLMIAEASDADRSVKAQGIVNPTMFNTWERYNNRNYSVPSWISRVRGSNYAFKHFAPVANSTSTTGEIQCNYWKSDTEPSPYFRYSIDSVGNASYVEEFDTVSSFNKVMVVYEMRLSSDGTIIPIPAWVYKFYVKIHVVLGTAFTGTDPSILNSFQFNSEHTFSPSESSIGIGSSSLYVEQNSYKVEHIVLPELYSNSWYSWETAKKEMLVNIKEQLLSVGLQDYIPEDASYNTMFDTLSESRAVCFNGNLPSIPHSLTDALNSGGANRWTDQGDVSVSGKYGNLVPSYCRKNIMFVDENVVTLDSPEIAYGKVSFDNAGYNFRVVGVIKQSGVQTDYTVDASKSIARGQSLDKVTFSRRVRDSKVTSDGIVSWPMWKDKSLDLKQERREEEAERKLDEEEALLLRTPDHYNTGNMIVRYWMYLWQQAGTISGYSGTTEDGTPLDFSNLRSKTFANLRFFYNTIYLASPINLERESIRVVDDVASVDYGMQVGEEMKYYKSIVNMPLSTPNTLKYPILYSSSVEPDTDKILVSDSKFLYSINPVMLEYTSSPHAVISLKTWPKRGGSYLQTLLPRFFDSEEISFAGLSKPGETGALLPWLPVNDVESLPVRGNQFVTYEVQQNKTTFVPNNTTLAESLSEGDKYLLIGEIYKDFGEGSEDSRYGGITQSDIEGNRFIAAGPLRSIEFADGSENVILYGNQGDTYFQRWDGIKTKPSSKESVNGIIEIMSAMLETHINLDGRTDRMRGIDELAGIDVASYGTLNNVYSQPNNFVVRRDLDEDFNLDEYRSSLTWTLEKADSALVDEWSHITLASVLKLDGDKGVCQALRRFQNSIVAFQDRGVAEILFNSRTQITTEDGSPIEIANSGKVDGKKYLSNKYGCLNKWSITEGKNGLYFVDNTNKTFCVFNGDVSDLSTARGFSAWFRQNNSIKSWTPKDFENIVSYYDRIHSDIYLVKKDGTEEPCLVYNENLAEFTSFYDYGSVQMLANVGDRFVSFHSGKLWFQNEGLFCNFFGKQYDFWVQYRVTPEPYNDKIWTNIDYRCDFYHVLDENGKSLVEGDLNLTDVNEWEYREWETFDTLRVWNEYQDTGDFIRRPFKKFRIWRHAIPRASMSATNYYGLDRIRNPWVNILFKKHYDDDSDSNQDLMQLHDITTIYFE